jgi:hypothetical protein
VYRGRVPLGRLARSWPVLIGVTLASLAGACLPEVPLERRPTPTPLPPPAPTIPPQRPWPYCEAGQTPHFLFGLANLKQRLGDGMGDPVECEHLAGDGSGDTRQLTTRGLAYYRKQTNVPSFTNGNDHWALTDSGLQHWTGNSVDPP